MYLEEIVLDGFKSYAGKTVIGPFHPQFNAISGLNGTGKSNILDSICFVMGIKSLQQMRVSKLDELIYKQGHAGVTKASVTLVFRNENPSSAPLGLAGIPKVTISRQIAVGGRDRFILNGHSTNLSDIQTIFQSVQLNVNNPHFLVVQGRITKVIHMKPLEILALVEETAGTRLYEVKRTECTRKIALKESKLKEIDSVMIEHIEPSLNALKKEQSDQSALLRGAQERSKLERICKGYEYYKLITEMQTNQEKLEATESELQQLESVQATAKQVCQTINKQIQEQDRLHKGRMTNKDPLGKINERFRECQKEFTVCSVATQEAHKALICQQEKVANFRNTAAEIQKRLDTALLSSKTQLEESESLKLIVSKNQSELIDLQDKLEEIRTGIVSGPNKKTFKEKLTLAEIELKQAEGELEQLKFVYKKDAERLEELREAKKSTLHESIEKELKELQQNRLLLENQLIKLKPKVDKLKYLKKKYQELNSQLFQIEETVEESRRKAPTQIARFHKENPEPSSEGIKGIVIELFEVKDEHIQYALALEEAGKSRLFNFVVTDDVVGQRVLEKYKQIRRVTCIPLNRIQSPKLLESKLNETKSLLNLPLDSSQVQRPLDVIRPISNEYVEALGFVFGRVYLCATTEIAQKIVEHPKIKVSTITLQGDFYSSSGSVSGGSRAGLGGVLSQHNSLTKALQEQENLLKEITALKLTIETLEKSTADYIQLEEKHETARISFECCAKRLEGLNSFSQTAQIQQIEKSMAETQEKIKFLEQEKIPALVNDEIPKLKDIIKSTKGSRENLIKEYEKKIQNCKLKFQKSEENLKNFNQLTSSSLREIAVLEQQLPEQRKQLADQEKELCNLESDHTNALLKEKAASENLMEIQNAIKRTEDVLDQKEQKRIRLEEQKKEAEQASANAEIETEKLQYVMRCCKQNLTDFTKKQKNLLNNYPWLKSVESQLNQPGTEFYFDKKTINGTFERLELVKRETENLQKKIGTKDVSSILDSSKQELDALRAKKEQLFREKAKLEEFIEELDMKKKKTMNYCWQQVNTNFSNIFSTLLLGSTAQLLPVSENNLEHGLEMSVTLSGVKKLSLGELSGGQRALLALSLILALLQYKPAPLYILDEIDAALDLSHTQRIGQMIRQEFRNSQFIIVSLKENLFNYADVLFKTSFVHGFSQVIRTEKNTFSKKENKNYTDLEEKKG